MSRPALAKAQTEVSFDDAELRRPAVCDRLKWKTSAGPRPIIIDEAAFFTHKRTVFCYIRDHLKQNDGMPYLLWEEGESIYLEEFAGSHLQTPLDPQYVIRRKKQVYISAAHVETFQVGVATKAETVVGA